MKNPVFPADSIVKDIRYDYCDMFSCTADSSDRLTADNIQVDFWTVMPGWVSGLMKLRNALVRPFGLKTEKGYSSAEEFEKNIRNGNNSGMFKVVGKTDKETVLLLGDSHLDAYVSVYVEDNNERQTVYATTLVVFHNALGRVYFSVICPFHKIIVKSMLLRTVKRLTA